MTIGRREYELYLSGKPFKLDKKIMEYFISQGVTNKYNYPFAYWKNMISDRYAKNNWQSVKPTLLSKRPDPNRVIELFDANNNKINDFYIVGNACLWLNGTIDGLDRVDIISDVVPAYMNISGTHTETDMQDPNNWNKTPFHSIDKIIATNLPMNGMPLSLAVLSGICDADMMAYDGNTKMIHMTNRGLHSVNKREVWLEPNVIDDDYANRLVQLYGLGFKIKVPNRQLIKLYGIDVTEDDKGVISDMMYANEGGDGEDWDQDIASLSRDGKDMANICLYEQSLGFTAYNKIIVSPIDRIFATFSGVTFREPVVQLRNMNQRDEDVNLVDLYLTSKYVANVDSLLNGKSMLDYAYERHILNREFNTPDDFGFTDYPPLFRDIAYLINNGLDELVYLGHPRDNSSFDDGINSGTYVIGALRYSVNVYNPYVCVHGSIHARDNIKEYASYAFDQGLFHKVPEQYYLYFGDKKTLREAVFYSKVDLEQIAFSPQDGGIYCSLLFLYAFYNKVHTLTPATHLNVVHRIRNTLRDIDIKFYNPSSQDDTEGQLQHVSDALLSYANYKGDKLFTDKGYEVNEDELELLNEPSERLVEIVTSAMKHGLSLGELPFYAGIGLPYASYVNPSYSMMINDKHTFQIHPLDEFGTLGSGDHTILLW